MKRTTSDTDAPASPDDATIPDYRDIETKRVQWTTVFRLAIFLVWTTLTFTGLFPDVLSPAVPVAATIYSVLAIYIAFCHNLTRPWINSLIFIDVTFVALMMAILGPLSTFAPLFFATIVVGHMCGSGRVSGRIATLLSIFAGLGVLAADAGFVFLDWKSPSRLSLPDIQGGYVGAATMLVLSLGTIYYFLDYTLTLLERYGQQERTIREAERAASIKTAELQRRAEQAYRLEALGRLAGGVAHDFNNLLTGITITMNELCNGLLEDDPRRQDIDDVIYAAQRTSSLVAQLLAFSSSQIVKTEAVILKDRLNGLQTMLGRIIGEDISFSLNIDPQLWNIKISPTHLDQILMNLVLNARDAMPNGGKIAIRAQNCTRDNWQSCTIESCKERPKKPHGPEVVCISISDTGKGIEPAIRDRIFEPFFTTKPSGLGSGLGLPTVYGILQQHGGRISIDSTPGQGATVSMMLPATLERPNTTDTPRSSAPTLSSEHILLVEDEQMVRRSLSRMLKRAGHRVLEAETGFQALSILDTQDIAPTLLLTDMIMPGMSGSELARHVVSRIPDIPIIFMSGYTENTDVHDWTHAGPHLFLSKPFDAQTLADAISRATPTTRAH